MFTVLTIMSAGTVLGFLLRNKTEIIKFVNPSINIAVYTLLFLLGVSVGSNETVISNLYTFGVQALMLAVGGIIGSVVLARLVFKTGE